MRLSRTGDADARRRTVGTCVKLVFLLAVLAFGGVFVARQWNELSAVFGRLSWPAVAVALPVAGLAQCSAMCAYRAISADLGAPLRRVASGRVYFVSQLGKYLPGTVWGMIALVTLSSEYRVPRKTSLATGLLALAFSVATAVVLAGLLLPFGALASVRHFWYVWVLVPLLPLGLDPAVFGTLIDAVLRRLGRQPLPQRMSWAGTMRAVGWQVLSWLLFGVHAWALLVGLGGRATPETLAVCVGGFALSYGIGPLFVLTPAGAGIRETGLVLTLGAVVGGATALAVALVSRVMLAVADFAQAGGWASAARRVPVVADPAELARAGRG